MRGTVYDGSDNWQQDFVFGDVIDQVLMLQQADILDYDGDQDTSEIARHYYHRNALGSVMGLSDPNQVSAVSYRYDPYGVRTITRAGQVQQADPLGQHWTFTARWLDEELNIYYYRYRSYRAQSGRFIQRDPLGLATGPNLYEYVESSPLNLVDPMGLSPPPIPVCHTTEIKNRTDQMLRRCGNVKATRQQCKVCCERMTQDILEDLRDSLGHAMRSCVDSHETTVLLINQVAPSLTKALAKGTLDALTDSESATSIFRALHEFGAKSGEILIKELGKAIGLNLLGEGLISASQVQLALPLLKCWTIQEQCYHRRLVELRSALAECLRRCGSRSDPPGYEIPSLPASVRHIATRTARGIKVHNGDGTIDDFDGSSVDPLPQEASHGWVGGTNCCR